MLSGFICFILNVVSGLKQPIKILRLARKDICRILRIYLYGNIP